MHGGVYRLNGPSPGGGWRVAAVFGTRIAAEAAAASEPGRRFDAVAPAWLAELDDHEGFDPLWFSNCPELAEVVNARIGEVSVHAAARTGTRDGEDEAAMRAASRRSARRGRCPKTAQ